jgi:hypothetical protein
LCAAQQAALSSPILAESKRGVIKFLRQWLRTGTIVAKTSADYLNKRAKWFSRPPYMRLALLIALFAAVFVLRGCFLRAGTDFPGAHFNRGVNAVWLGVDWVNNTHDESEIIALANELDRRQVRDIFVYVSYLKPDGEFNPTYDHAAEFVQAIKAAQPSLKIQAWIGLPVTGSGLFADGYVDLSERDTRNKIVAFSADLVQQMGFDGVHLDPEPVASDDANVLMLLEELRPAIGTQNMISIAARQVLPILSDARLPLIEKMRWRVSYYRKIAQRVDQIAVMTYDSSLPLAFLYRQWMRFQVIEISRAVADAGVDLLFGVPTSEEWTSSHWPGAENITSGLKGVVDGLNDAQARPSVVTGVAFYPYWETDENEWSIYETLWLGR